MSAPIPVVDPRPLKLDLACGQTPKEGFTGVDKFCGDSRFDLVHGGPWPWNDSTVDELHCSHFIEHIPMIEVGGVDALVHFFNQAYRVAKPDASFTVQWPALKSTRAFQDPTHRRFIPAETLQWYMSKVWRTANNLEHYLGATCNWAMTSFSPLVDHSQAFGKSDIVQAQYYRDHWDFTQDLVVVLKAVK